MASIEKIQIGGVTYDLSASGNYVEKTGDTMTGDLTMSNSKINFGTNLNVGVNSSNDGVLTTAGTNTAELNNTGFQVITQGMVGIKTTALPSGASSDIHLDAAGGGVFITSTSKPV